MVSNLDNIKFLHPVGASTFKYGVTIPVEAQTERMRAIEKGGKVPVTILFGAEEPVVAEIRRLNKGLKCDFEKNGIWVEVEFGNARSYYQDYVKFILAQKYRGAKLGLLLCPTTSFAALLCELGRQRARENVLRERPPVYSGMMSYEKAARELPFLGFMFDMPIVVAGVGVSGS